MGRCGEDWGGWLCSAVGVCVGCSSACRGLCVCWGCCVRWLRFWMLKSFEWLVRLLEALGAVAREM